MSLFKVKAREIRSFFHRDGDDEKAKMSFLHPSGTVVQVDDDDPRIEHYRRSGALVPVRKKGDASADDSDAAPDLPPADPNAEGSANNPAPVNPDAPTE